MKSFKHSTSLSNFETNLHPLNRLNNLENLLGGTGYTDGQEDGYE